MSEPFNFWQDHSERFLLMAYLYERQKVMEHPSCMASKTGTCGDSITIYLAINQKIITDFSYELQGCIHTNACCNALAEMSKGKTIDQCWEITPDTIISFLETLPKDHFHCAELAVGTFYLALSRYDSTPLL